MHSHIQGAVLHLHYCALAMLGVDFEQDLFENARACLRHPRGGVQEYGPAQREVMACT